MLDNHFLNHMISFLCNKMSLWFFRWFAQEEMSSDIQTPNTRDVSLPRLQCLHYWDPGRGQSMPKHIKTFTVLSYRSDVMLGCYLSLTILSFLSWHSFPLYCHPLPPSLDVSFCHQCLVSFHQAAVWALPFPTDRHLSGPLLRPGAGPLVPVQVNQQLSDREIQSACVTPLSLISCFCVSVYSGHQSILVPPLELETNASLWLTAVSQYKVRVTFCSYSVMEMCTKGLGSQTEALRVSFIHSYSLCHSAHGPWSISL